MCNFNVIRNSHTTPTILDIGIMVSTTDFDSVS